MDVVEDQFIDEVVGVAHGEREAQHLVQLALHGLADAGLRRERRGVLDDIAVACERPLQNAPADVYGQHPADWEERKLPQDSGWENRGVVPRWGRGRAYVFHPVQPLALIGAGAAGAPAVLLQGLGVGGGEAVVEEHQLAASWAGAFRVGDPRGVGVEPDSVQTCPAQTVGVEVSRVAAAQTYALLRMLLSPFRAPLAHGQPERPPALAVRALSGMRSCPHSSVRRQ
ncbi:hypothetical protein ACIQB5_47655 [Streptomyces sp. NPDC088560]|uniref:hypothetical protein n=1 Tax=Streptomyces sp. NPDC088560 TaxID=3365868 RepID=UPI0038146DF0